MDDMNESGFSLADLADLDVSDIEEVRYTAIPAGAYDFEVTKADFEEESKDGESRYKIAVEMKIIEVKALLEPGLKAEDFLEKVHTERFYIKPQEEAEKVQAAIGRVRAFVTDIGQDSKGKLGDIVRNTVGHTFTGKITNRKNKDDPANPFKALKLDGKANARG